MLQWCQGKTWTLSYVFSTFLGLLTSLWWKRHKEVRIKLPAFFKKKYYQYPWLLQKEQGEIFPNLNRILTFPEAREDLYDQGKPWLSDCNLQNLDRWKEISPKGKEALPNSCTTPSPVKFHLLQWWGSNREKDGCVLRLKLVGKLHVVMEITVISRL